MIRCLTTRLHHRMLRCHSSTAAIHDRRQMIAALDREAMLAFLAERAFCTICADGPAVVRVRGRRNERLAADMALSLSRQIARLAETPTVDRLADAAALKLAHDYPEYQAAARKVRIVKTTADRYYGRGYQDVQNRVPRIDNTMRELGWRPRHDFDEGLRATVRWYLDHRGWWERVMSGAYRGERLGLAS